MKIILENWKRFVEQEEVGTKVVFPDWLKDKLTEVHTETGQGSVFAKSIDEVEQIVKNIIADRTDIEKVANSTGTITEKISGIGYDLVMPSSEAQQLPDAQMGTTEKTEGPNKIEVPMVTTSAPMSQFSTDQLTIIVRPMKDDSKQPIQGSYIILSAFPGNPNVPPASEWKGKWTVVVPS